MLPNVAASADAAKEAYDKGEACLDKQDFDPAITAFTEAIRLNPKHAWAHSERGHAYEMKGDRVAATADYMEAIYSTAKFVAINSKRKL